MDKDLLVKLAKILVEKEESEKTAEMDKVAEIKAAYELGQYTAESFIDEFNKVAQLASAEDETEKLAAVYDDYGRAMAREYFASLIKQAEGEKAEEKKEDEKEEKDEEGEKEEKKEESKDEEKKEEKKASVKTASAKDRLVSALKQIRK